MLNILIEIIIHIFSSPFVVFFPSFFGLIGFGLYLIGFLLGPSTSEKIVCGCLYSKGEGAY